MGGDGRTFWDADRVREAVEVLGRHSRVSDACAEMAGIYGKPQVCPSGLFRALIRSGLEPPSSYLLGATLAKKAAPVVQPALQGPSLSQQLADLRSRTPRRPPKPAKGRGESAVLLIADTHVGESDNEAAKRIEALPARVSDALVGRTIDEIVVCLLGDICAGEGVYPGQWASLNLWANDQVRNARAAIWSAIQDLHTLAPVRVVAVPGNHGRTSHGGGSASPGANWDVMVYQQLELLCDMTPNGPRWEGHEERGESVILDVKGHRGLITHGGGKNKLRLGAQWTTPAAAIKWVDQGLLHNVSWVACGHLHHPHMGKRNGQLFVLSGALGSGEATALGRRDTPMTWLLTMTREQMPSMACSIEFGGGE